MNFKAYDIFSSLIPGFLVVLMLLNLLKLQYDSSLVVVYTAISFLLGFIMNTISSWMEDFYFWTWGGKPSKKLLNGKDIWKVRFYHGSKAKSLLLTDSNNPQASTDELFAIAMRFANGSKDTRIEDFNSIYAFSRTLFTTLLIGTIVLLIEHYDNWRYYAILLPSLFVLWLRCKQRAYYYVREVLNVYLKSKNA